MTALTTTIAWRLVLQVQNHIIENYDFAKVQHKVNEVHALVTGLFEESGLRGVVNTHIEDKYTNRIIEYRKARRST